MSTTSNITLNTYEHMCTFMMLKIYNELNILLKDRNVIIEKESNGHITNILVSSTLSIDDKILISCEYSCYNPGLPTFVVYNCDDPYEPGLHEPNYWRRNNIDDIISAVDVIFV
jgi:hypothetical protein